MSLQAVRNREVLKVFHSTGGKSAEIIQAALPHLPMEAINTSLNCLELDGFIEQRRNGLFYFVRDLP